MSDSKKGVKLEFRSEPFPTIKLTNSSMSKLLDVIYDFKQANASFTVIIIEKKTGRSFAFTHKDDFLDEFHNYINKFELIKISLDYTIKKFSLELWNNKKSTYSIISDDSNWSRDIRSKITEVLENYQTKYDFLHSRKSWIIWASFGIVVGLLYLKPSNSLFYTIINIIFFPWSIAYWSSVFIRWLFPRFEVENTLQMRFRRWILGGLIGGIIVAIIAGLLLSLFR